MGINGVKYTWPSSIGAGGCVNIDGSGIISIVSCGSGGGGGGSASLSLGKGSAVDFTQVSSPTSHINLSTGDFFVSLVSPSTAYVTLDFSRLFASSPTWTGSHVFIDSVTFKVPISSLTTQGNLVVIGSANVQGVITSTTGFQVAGSSAVSLGLGLGASGVPSLYFNVNNGRRNGLYSQGTNLIYTNAGSDIFSLDSGGGTMGNSLQYRATLNTSGVPQYTWSTALASGLYMRSSDLHMLFYLGGLELLRLDNGNSGIVMGGMDRVQNVGVLIGTMSSSVNGEIVRISSGINNPRLSVDGSSTTVWGGIYVNGNSSVSANSLEARGSTIATQTYNLVLASPPVQGQHLFVAQMNGINAIIAGGGDAVGTGGGASPITATDWNIKNTTDMTKNQAQDVSFSTFAVQIDSISQTIGGVAPSTRARASFDDGRASTSDARGDTFVNFRSTSDTLFNNIISTQAQMKISTSTLETQMAQTTIVGYNNGVALTGKITAINFQGGASIAGTTVTVPASAAGGAVFGYNSTTTINMNGFSLDNSTGLSIGTTEFALLTITSVTHTGVSPHYVTITSGTIGNETEKLFQITKASTTFGSSTNTFAGPIVIAKVTELPSTIQSNLFLTGASSISLQSGGGVNSSSYAVRGYSLVATTWTTPTVRSMDTYVFRWTSGTIPANTTITLSASQMLPGATVMDAPLCTEIQINASATSDVEIASVNNLPTSIDIRNGNVTSIQGYACGVWVKTP